MELSVMLTVSLMTKMLSLKNFLNGVMVLMLSTWSSLWVELAFHHEM